MTTLHKTRQVVPQLVASQHTAADEDLEHRLVNFLFARHVPDSDNLDVEAHNGTVLVSGRLKSRRAKWLCVECCRRVAGVVRLVDQIEQPRCPARRSGFQAVGDE